MDRDICTYRDSVCFSCKSGGAQAGPGGFFGGPGGAGGGVRAVAVPGPRAAGDFDLALTTLTARCDDPMEYLLPFRGTSESNVCGYRNDTFDLLVGVAESTGDLTARAAFLHDAEAMLLEDSAVSPLCFSGTAYLLREGLTGVSHDCFGHSYFTAVSRAETGPAA